MKFYINRDTIDYLNDYFTIGSQYTISPEQYPVVLLLKEEGLFTYYIQYLCVDMENEPKIEELILSADAFKKMIDSKHIIKLQ